MSINSNYLFVVNMDVDADKEALFNEIYDNEHIPNLLKVPGVRGVTRMAGEPFAMSIGGAEKKVPQDGPRYSGPSWRPPHCRPRSTLNAVAGSGNCDLSQASEPGPLSNHSI
jgi:hypothetical protein